MTQANARITLLHAMTLQRSATLLALATLLFLTGCGKGLSGTYVPNDDSFAGVLIERIVFTSGSEVEITAMGMTRGGTYTVDGDRVKITVAGDTSIFTIAGNCIDGGGMLGKFCKK